MLTSTLFNQQALDQQLAAGENQLTLYREILQNSEETLKQEFFAGTSIRELVITRALLLTRLLSHLWQRCVETQDEQPALTLIAVGGFGRGELHPASDVDIMVLGTEKTLTDYQKQLERFVTILWDIGLEVGHSVRTIADCERESTADITVITNLMEARLICGDEGLFDAMREATSPKKMWPNEAFFAAKKEEQKRRYRKYHETAYNLEPNVKEGPGGLRDIHTAAWVAKRYFNVITLYDLVKYDFLTENEYTDLVACQDFLWQVRFALHTVTGRREDRLLFDYQRNLAELFGYQDQDSNLAVEQFMQRYYRTIAETGRLNEILLQHFEETILLAKEKAEPIVINRRFQARKGFLEVTSDNIFRRYPFALLEVFLLLQQNQELNGVRASTVRLIRAHRHLIDDKFRADVRGRSLFMEILRQPVRLTRQLRRMNRYGVLAAYLPEFAAIVGRMQYDLFHVYTVDQHTLFVVRNLRRFYVPKFSHEYPHCSAIIRRLPKPELLYIAGIYHDIAKGRGGDHSILGAEDAEQFCRRHDLSDADTRLVAWLVRHHLTLSLTAQKKDIHDPEIINEFAQFVGTQLYLDYLYLLTVADIRATNPSMWNSWRASLLYDLYEASKRALRRGLDNLIDKAERISAIQQQALTSLQRKRISKQRVQTVWQGFSEDYFLRYSVAEIIWHTRAILKKADDGRALVLANPELRRGGTEIFIYTRDSGPIFAIVTATLDRLRINILDARITTSRNGYAIDSFTISEQSGEPVAERRRLKEILDALREQLNSPMTKKLGSNRKLPRIMKHFPTSTEINFEQDDTNQRTLLEIITSDRPGLLSRVGQAFTECEVQLQTAKIATIGARAEDIFFITDQSGKPLLQKKQQQRLEKALLEYFDKPANQAA